MLLLLFAELSARQAPCSQFLACSLVFCHCPSMGIEWRTEADLDAYTHGIALKQGNRGNMQDATRCSAAELVVDAMSAVATPFEQA